MPISFAGIGIQPPPISLGALDVWSHLHVLDEWDYIGYRVPGVQHLPVPYPPKREPPRIGVLSWPVGADRFATCHLIATGQQVQDIRDVIGTSPTAQPLVFDDGTTTITADMFAIVRPISQRGNSKELYLLTLVDDRHFWWASGGDVLSSAPVSWSALFTSLFTLVGVTPTSVDSVPAAYLTPNSARWFSTKPRPVPILLESAARQVGMKIVRRLDGTVRVVTTENAITEDSARWSQFSSLAMAGGQITAPDAGRFSPASVDVAFFDGTTTNITLASLGLSEFEGVLGVASKKALWTADPAAPTAPEKTAYATQAATDYYQSFLSLTDADLRSFQDVDPVGMDDCVEWVHSAGSGGVHITRIKRPNWFDRNIYGTSAPPTPATGSAPEYLDECLNGFLIRYKATISLDDSGLSQTTYAFEKSLGVRCAPQSSSGSTSSGGGPTPDPNTTYPTAVDSVTEVCPDLTTEDPAGAIIILPTNRSYTYFLTADGSAVSRTTYAELFTAIGTTFGAGNGTTTFNLPTLTAPGANLAYYVRVGQPVLTVQSQRTTIQAFGSVTGLYCADNPDGCCPDSGSGGSTREDCCGDEPPLDVVTFAATGPMGASCSTCTVTGDVVRQPGDVLFWELQDPVSGCGGLVGMAVVLYCAALEWRASGWIQPADFTEVVYFDIELTFDTTNLIYVGEITIPGCEHTVLIGFEPPCQGVSYNCVAGSCVEVAGTGGTYSSRAACEAVCGGGGSGGGIETPCCPGVFLPPVLYLTPGGTLTGLGGGSILLLWNGSTVLPVWSALVSGCGGTVSFDFSCVGQFSIQVGGSASGTTTASAASCSPLVWNSGNFPVSSGGGCNGTASVTVNEVP